MSLQQYLALWRWESEHTFINPHTNEPGLGKEKFNFHQIRRLPTYSRSPLLNKSHFFIFFTVTQTIQPTRKEGFRMNGYLKYVSQGCGCYSQIKSRVWFGYSSASSAFYSTVVCIFNIELRHQPHPSSFPAVLETNFLPGI